LVWQTGGSIGLRPKVTKFFCALLFTKRRLHFVLSSVVKEIQFSGILFARVWARGFC